MGASEVKISLCTIVKNDGLLIRKMLDSVVGVVDEIVITDTGSTDNTLEVVREFQLEHPGLVKVVEFAWCNDFSAARNFSLEQASGDWVIVLDADEFLDSEEKRGLRSFLETVSADGIFVTQRNYTGSMKDLSSVIDVDVARVFRGQYRYEGSIHEQIAGNIERAGGKFGRYTLHIHHVGYTEEYVKLKGKSARNTELLEQQLKAWKRHNKIERWFSETNLLAEYSGQNKWDEVASRARMLIEEIKKEKPKNYPNFFPRIYKFCVNGLRFTNKLDDALRIAKEGVSRFPKHTDLQVQRAEIHMQRDEFREAIDVLQKCRELGDVQFDLTEYIEGSGTYTAARAMAGCWLRLGDTLSALEWFVTSYKENTEQLGVVPWIVALSADQEVLRTMEKVIQTPARYDEFIQFYSFKGYDDAIEYIEKTEEKWGVRVATARARFAYEVRHNQTPTTTEPLWLGLYAYEQGNYTKAIQYWEIAGAIGQYFKAVCEGTTPLIKWEVKNVFSDIFAAKSVRLLSDFGHYISDLKDYFPMIMNSDLLSAFCSQDFMRMKEPSHEVAEWKVQLAITQGNRRQAERFIERMVLPSGEKTVRGNLIEADLRQNAARDILLHARKVYPESMMLQHVWYQSFAEATILQ